MKYIKPFRLAFVLLFIFVGIGLGMASYDSYRGVNLLVTNHTSKVWHFGFNSMVRGETREILFRGKDSDFSLAARSHFFIGIDAERERIIGAYLKTEGTEKEISCAEGFSHYQLVIRETSVQCIHTKSKISRWLANLRYSYIYLGTYLAEIQELLYPAA